MMKEFFKRFKFLWEQVPSKYKRHYVIYTLVSFVHAAIFLILPFIFKDIIDAFTKGKNSNQSILLYIVITVLGYLSIRLWSLSNVYTRERMRKILTDNLFSSSLRMEPSHFKTKKSGYWANIFSRDTVMTTQMFSDFVYTLPEEGITLVVVLTVLSFYCLPIFFLTLVSLVLIVLLSIGRDKYAIPEYDRSQESLRKVNELTNTYLKGMEDIKHYRAEKLFLREVTNGMKTYGRNLFGYLKKDFLLSYSISSVSEFIKIGSVGISLLFFLSGNFTFGTAILLIQFASIAYEKANYLFENVKWLQNFPSHIRKVEMVIESPRMEIPTMGSKDFYGMKLRNIGVKYDNKWLVRKFSMELKKGEKVALLGKSGAGKSTILKVITGRLIPTEGFVRFLPEHPEIGILAQNPYLFNRTIKENLLMAKPTAGEEDVKRALEFCGLMKFVEDLPNGVDTMVGQAGKLISGGERARLALARLVLLDPELVIVDEPLTGVDEKRKDEILQYFLEFLRYKTCVIVTHDPKISQIASGQIYLEEVPDL